MDASAFIRLDFDGTGYQAWVRETTAARDRLWKLTLKSPEFPMELLVRKASHTDLAFGAKDLPVTLQMEAAILQVLFAQKLEGLVASGACFKRPAISSPPACVEVLREILIDGETVVWWAFPGKTDARISMAMLGLILAALLCFSFYWTGLAGLCSKSTPIPWMWPCFGLVGGGAAFLGAAIFHVLRLVVRSIRYKPVYVVTDRRALVVSPQGIIADYAPWEMSFAEVKKRGTSATVIFPTQSVRSGNFFDVSEFSSLEGALSALLVI